MVREFHLFAGIGGGIYAGELLGHRCCAGVEIMKYAKSVLRQRQKDKWLRKFPIYSDLCQLHGERFRGRFDVLCGGFPCQAFSSAAHGANIPEKNLWGEMFRFVQESQAPVVFGENVVYRAIHKAALDLESVGYKVKTIRLCNADLGADHQRFRFWLLAVRDGAEDTFRKIARHDLKLPKFSGRFWSLAPEAVGEPVVVGDPERSMRLIGVGNAQSPFVAATAFRILVNRHLDPEDNSGVLVKKSELAKVFVKRRTWIQTTYGEDFGFVHTPTTVANYCCPSMQKHQGCRNYIQVFCDDRGIPEDNRRPDPTDAEYLMGFPIGASSLQSLPLNNINQWKGVRNAL